ncbi:hypothetical protein HDU81_002936 [Chytriomyces hyalinus]|nr:hypothetical protein HDU81_002936 [Chytriomyces hyalinus]
MEALISASERVIAHKHGGESLRTLCAEIEAALSVAGGTAVAHEDLDPVEAAAISLWNESVAIRGSDLETVVRLRGTALMMLHMVANQVAGSSSSVQVRARILTIAVATGRAYHEFGETDNAHMAFELAAKYAQDETEEPHYSNDKVAKESAMLLNYRAEILWRKNQSNVAFHLMNRACNSRFIEKLTIREIEVIAETCKNLAAISEKKTDSVQWLKICLNLLLGLIPTPKTEARKTQILLLLASEYYQLDSLDIADTIVTQLLNETEGLIALSAFLIKFKILDKRQVKDPECYSAACKLLQERVALVNAKEDAINLLFTILHLIAPHSTSDALKLADWLLAQNESIPEKASLFERVFLVKIHLLASPTSKIVKEEALESVKAVIRTIGVAGNVSSNGSSCAQMIVWRSGINAMNEHRYQDAIDWLNVALKLVTGASNDDRNSASIQLKLALAYSQLRRYDEAMEACTRVLACKDQSLSMSAVYIQFLIHLEENQIKLAESCLTDLASRLKKLGDRKKELSFLLTSMERCFKNGNQQLLKHVLAMIAKQCRIEDNEYWRRVLLVITRCLIRLSMVSDTSELGLGEYTEILNHMEQASKILESANQQVSDEFPPIQSEFEWFRQTCWNLAIKTAVNFTTVSCQFFSCSARILSLSVADGAEPSLELLNNKKISLYVALLGEVEQARDAGQAGVEHIQRARRLLDDLLSTCRKLILTDAGLTGKDKIYHESLALEYELILLEYEYLKPGGSILESIRQCVTRATEEVFPVKIFQRMADLCLRMNPPSSVVFFTVGAALAAMMKQETHLDLQQFAQWLRLMISASPTTEVSIEMYQQALEIMQSSGGMRSYPDDEIQWLQNTACAGDKENAVMWCEMALKICVHLPEDCADQVAQMTRDYGEILAE